MSILKIYRNPSITKSTLQMGIAKSPQQPVHVRQPGKDDHDVEQLVTRAYDIILSRIQFLRNLCAGQFYLKTNSKLDLTLAA